MAYQTLQRGPCATEFRVPTKPRAATTALALAALLAPVRAALPPPAQQAGQSWVRQSWRPGCVVRRLMPPPACAGCELGSRHGPGAAGQAPALQSKRLRAPPNAGGLASSVCRVGDASLPSVGARLLALQGWVLLLVVALLLAGWCRAPTHESVVFIRSLGISLEVHRRVGGPAGRFFHMHEVACSMLVEVSTGRRWPRAGGPAVCGACGVCTGGVSTPPRQPPRHRRR
jgi:hypothetical protein